MDDLEARLRAAVRQRADELEPASDLPDRIQSRVARRRRRHRLQVGVLATAMTVLAAVGLSVALGRPSDEGSVEVGSQQLTTTTSEPTRRTTSTAESTTSTTTTTASTGEAPGTTATTGRDAPPGTAAPPTQPSPSGTAATSTTTSTPPDLRPPDSDQPAAGTCGQASGGTVEVTMNPDIPSPRCVRVTADQRLQVRNAAEEQITVSFAGFSVDLAPGAAQVFDRPFGEYLQPGVHRVHVSLYGDSGPEIWLAP